MTDPILFRFTVRNDVTAETAQFLGQGASIPEAWAEGWANACEDFGKSSSGAPPISVAKLAVTLSDGRVVHRRPAAFASRAPYQDGEDAKPAPTPEPVPVAAPLTVIASQTAPSAPPRPMRPRPRKPQAEQDLFGHSGR